MMLQIYRKTPFVAKCFLLIFLCMYGANILSGGELVKLLCITNVFAAPWQEWYRPLSCLFCHQNLLHLAANSFALLFTGFLLKEAAFSKAYPFLFLVGGILAELTQCGIYVFLLHIPVGGIGASSACFSLLGGLLVLHCSKHSPFRFQLGTLPVNYLLGYGILSNMFGISALLAHALGLFFGVLITMSIFKIKKGLP